MNGSHRSRLATGLRWLLCQSRREPALPPAVPEAVHDVGRVAAHLQRTRERLDRPPGRRDLHRAGWWYAASAPSRERPVGNDPRPPAGARVPAAGTIGVHDVSHSRTHGDRVCQIRVSARDDGLTSDLHGPGPTPTAEENGATANARRDETGGAHRAASPEPVTQRGRRTRALLLEAARRVFEEKGFTETRIGDITAEADVAHGTFYTYFESKHELFREVVGMLVNDFTSRGPQRPRPGPEPRGPHRAGQPRLPARPIGATPD